MIHFNPRLRTLPGHCRLSFTIAILSAVSAPVCADLPAVASYNVATEAARFLKQDLRNRRVQCAEVTSSSLESGSKCWRGKKDQRLAIAETVDMIRGKFGLAYADAQATDKPRVLHEQIDFEVQLYRYCDATLTFEVLIGLESYVPDSVALARDAIMHFEVLSLCAREASAPEAVIAVMNEQYPAAKAHYYGAGMSGPGHVQPKRRMVVAWRRVVEAFAWGSDDVYANAKVAAKIWSKWDDLQVTWDQLIRMGSLFLCPGRTDLPIDAEALRKQYALLIGSLEPCN